MVVVQAKAEQVTAARVATHLLPVSQQSGEATADTLAAVEEATVDPAVQAAAAVQQETAATVNATAVVVAVAPVDQAQADPEPLRKVSTEQTMVPGEQAAQDPTVLGEPESHRTSLEVPSRTPTGKAAATTATERQSVTVLAVDPAQ